MKDYYAGMTYQPLISQLLQLTHLTWDGDLISKSERTKLVKAELAQRVKGGWNIITSNGIEYLEKLKFIHP